MQKEAGWAPWKVWTENLLRLSSTQCRDNCEKCKFELKQRLHSNITGIEMWLFKYNCLDKSHFWNIITEQTRVTVSQSVCSKTRRIQEEGAQGFGALSGTVQPVQTLKAVT